MCKCSQQDLSALLQLAAQSLLVKAKWILNPIFFPSFVQGLKCHLISAQPESKVHELLSTAVPSANIRHVH